MVTTPNSPHPKNPEGTIRFVGQVFSLAKALTYVAFAVIPAVFLIRLPINFLGEVARYASEPNSLPQLATLGEPLVRTMISFVAAVIGAALMSWMTKVFIEDLEKQLPVESKDSTRSYSIVLGALTAFSYVLAVVLGFALGLIPGLVLLVRGVVCVPVAVSESVNPFRALSRSWELTERKDWPIQVVLWILLLMTAVAVAILVGVGFAVPGANTNIGRSVLMSIGNALGWPVVMATVASAYVRLANPQWLANHEQVGATSGLSRAEEIRTERRQTRLGWAGYALVAALVFGCVWAVLQAEPRAATPAEARASSTEESSATAELDATAASAASNRSGLATSTAADADPWQPIDAEDASPGYLFGKVIDAKGGPPYRAYLWARPADAWISGKRYTGLRTGFTARDGTFRIGPLTPGRFVVEVPPDRSGGSNRGFAARPTEAVEVGPGRSVEVNLTMERVLAIRLPVLGANGPFETTLYYLEDGLHPKEGGFATSRLHASRRQSELKFKTLRGRFRLSPDPCFDPRSEVYTFEADADGTVHGPAGVPRQRVNSVEVQLLSSNGASPDVYTGRLVRVCTPPDSYGTRSTSASPNGTPASEDRVLFHRVPDGTTWRVIVVAKGYGVVESDPFTSKAGAPPVRVALHPEGVATITLRVVGLPDNVRATIRPDHFTVFYRSPSGVFVEAPKGWQLEEGSRDAAMTLEALPDGARIHVHFSYVGADGRFSAYADIEIADEAEHVLLAHRTKLPTEPLLWNGVWHRKRDAERISRPIWVEGHDD